MTRIEELALHLFGQLRDGDLKRSDIELIEDAIGNAYEEGRQSVPSRITELEQALRLHLAVSPDDPLLIEPVEQEVVRLRARLEAAEKERVRFQKYYETATRINGELKAKLEAVEKVRDEYHEQFVDAAESEDRLRTQLATAQAKVKELEEQLGGKHGH